MPTHDHGPTLHHSVGSALAQTVEDIEVMIVGDGMPDFARQVARELERADERVRLFDNQKGARHGELHRHAALAEARASLVFYLSDDDLWFPEHVESLAATFEESGADFVHAPPVWRMGDGSWYRWIVDLAVPRYRELIFEKANRVGLSSAAHTLEAYRRLPYGWCTAPPCEWTDAWMWRQFAEQPGMRFACSRRPTALNLPASVRGAMSQKERLAELAECAQMLQDPLRRLAFLEELFSIELDRLVWFETHTWELEEWLADRERAINFHATQAEHYRQTVAVMEASRRWRLGERLVRARSALSRRRA